jgi:hypothetical protein
MPENTVPQMVPSAARSNPTSRLADYYAANPQECRFSFFREPYTKRPSPYRFHRNSIRHQLALYDCLIEETERVHRLGVTSDEEYVSALQSQVSRRRAVALQIAAIPDVYRYDLAAVLEQAQTCSESSSP